MVHVLVADDVADVRFACEQILCGAGHVVITASDGREARDLMDHNDFDLIVTDIMMPNEDGLQLAIHAHNQKKCPKILGITGGSDRMFATEAAKLGQCLFDQTLIKPVKKSQLLEAVDALLDKKIEK